jgi:hypothetical protein
MTTFPKPILPPVVVKAFRDRIAGGGAPLTVIEFLDLVGSHEQLRAIALTRSERLRQTELERDRLQKKIEELAEGKAR